MEPLYYFKLDKRSGDIAVTEITDYVERESSYRWVDRSQLKFCYKQDLDRFKNDHVYSLNSDKNAVKETIIRALNARAQKAFTDYNDLTVLITNIIREN